MKDTSNRFVLRDATRREHDVLDSTIGGFVDKRSYLHYLTGLEGFRGCVERGLAHVVLHNRLAGWRPTEILPHVQRDIIDLGGIPSAMTARLAWSDDIGTQIGILYVLEGSALGARVLMRRASALGYDNMFGARHLAAQTARSDAWPFFVSLLDDMPEEHVEHAIAGARMTFLTALNAFGELAHRERAG